MPRAPSFKTQAIRELDRQLRFVPPATRERQMLAAEQLIEDVEEDRLYPPTFVTWRITSYRPEDADDEATLVGAALIGDLVSFIQRLSDGLELPLNWEGRTALSIDDVARRLEISPKTVQRSRRSGLVFHYLIVPGEGKRLCCFEDALERFTHRHQEQLDHAAGFTRLSDDELKQIIAQARALRAQTEISLHQAARQLAKQHSRAHETLRAILQRHDRDAAEPIFDECGPLSPRAAKIAHRAWKRGIVVKQIAQRLSQTPATMHRAINRRRAAVLRGVDLSYFKLPTFELEDASHIILSAPAVTDNLNDLLDGSDVLALIDQAHTLSGVDEAMEDALVAGYNFLKYRVHGALMQLGAWPSTREMDAIECDLRWSTMLMHRLVSLALPQAIGRIEQNLHRSLTQQPADRIIALIKLATGVARDAINQLDPARGQRLERMTAHAMDRALATPPGSDLIAEAPGRAAARHAAGDAAAVDLYTDVTPWQRLLDLRPDLHHLVDQLDEKPRFIIIHHFGLDGRAPRSSRQLAEELGTTPEVINQTLRAANQVLRRHVRGPDSGSRGS